ncbi:unnamed protein product [Phytophthora fragariaefolia]|uniref:Unnamed protein product n=1 Tax=Phytophthora fragariaefolia TaxID=1490495 RepID=A0A9W6XDJ5_9STRA|nr:unnamed protein product [Phytophthora fragariaefolia]
MPPDDAPCTHSAPVDLGDRAVHPGDEQVCIEESGDLYAEDVEGHLAVLPEVTPTTECNGPSCKFNSIYGQGAALRTNVNHSNTGQQLVGYKWGLAPPHFIQSDDDDSAHANRVVFAPTYVISVRRLPTYVNGGLITPRKSRLKTFRWGTPTTTCRSKSIG